MKTTFEIATNFMDNVAVEVCDFLFATLNVKDIDNFTFEWTGRIEEMTKKLFATMCEEFGIDEVEEPTEG